MTTTLGALLDEHPAATDELLLADDDTELTSGEVAAAVAARAAELAAAGVGAGDSVAIVLPNRVAFVVAMFAIWRVGAVMVPINVRAPRPEQEELLDAAGAGAVIDDDGVVVRPGNRPPSEPGVAFITWTSGTTGRPRPIRHGHTEYLELLDRVLAPLRSGTTSEPASAPTPNLVPVALALNAGIYNVLFGLRAGAPVVILDRFDPSRFASVVARYRIRSTVLPPAAMTMLNESDVADLAPLRYVRSITAPLSPLQAVRFRERFGVVVLNGYGQAEIGEVIGWTARDAREHPEKLGAVGRPHPGVAVRVVPLDPDPDHPSGVGSGPVGRLWVRPPRRALGEGGDDALAARIDADGYVDTGDLARIDADGFVWLEGRAGEVINRGGNKVFPEAVEDVLRLHPGVRDVAVAGRPDDRLGEVPVAYIVADAPLDAAELAEWCRERLVPYKVPVQFEPVAHIPRNEIGKVLRRELGVDRP